MTRLEDARNAKTPTVTMSAQYARFAGLARLIRAHIAHLAQRLAVDPSQLAVADERPTVSGSDHVRGVSESPRDQEVLSVGLPK